MMFYTYQTVTELKLAYNYNINHNIVHILCSIKVKTCTISHTIFDIHVSIQFKLCRYCITGLMYHNMAIYRYIVASLLPTKYDEIRQRVMKVLMQVKHLSLTTDIWTSRATKSLLTVTVHFIHSWKLKSLVLATIKFYTKHTGGHIAGELQRITDHWEITQKVVAVVTDNASNMVAAIRITGWTHIHCFAHTLNLVVQEAIRNDPLLLLIKKKCKDIVTFFHQSVNATEKLREIRGKLVSKKRN